LELSPTLAVAILANTSQVYQFTAKIKDDDLEIWYMPQEWIGYNTIPDAYQALPKEWVTIPNMDIFIAPRFEANEGVKVIQHIFRASIDGTRRSNPENPEQPM
jgi:hypothetical protein